MNNPQETVTRYSVQVQIALRQDILDPAGRATAKSLQDLGYSADEVRIGKIVTLVLEADSAETARNRAQEMTVRLLANPVMEDYTLEVTPKD